MTRHWKELQNESGATSVLVIFMMIILVTLGAFALTSANVNYKFSMRAADWNTMYYDLDARGEEFLAALDTLLGEAEKTAIDYMEGLRYTAAETTELPAGLQADVNARYRETGEKPDDNAMNEMLNMVYFYYAGLNLDHLKDLIDEAEVYTWGEFTDEIYVTARFQSERSDNEDCGLIVSVWVESLEYGTDSASRMIRANTDTRYRIEQWYEYQESDVEEPAIELWDGTIK